MKTALVLLAAASMILVSTSCDKHSWDSTKVLHEGMHKDHHGDDHGQSKDHHEKKDDHAPAAKH
jgi:hypothetical protein